MGAHSGGVKGVITPQTALMNEGSPWYDPDKFTLAKRFPLFHTNHLGAPPPLLKGPKGRPLGRTVFQQMCTAFLWHVVARSYS